MHIKSNTLDPPPVPPGYLQTLTSNFMFIFSILKAHSAHLVLSICARHIAIHWNVGSSSATPQRRMTLPFLTALHCIDSSKSKSHLRYN